MSNTFTLTDIEMSYLRILIWDRVEKFKNSYTTLIKAVFEERKKILLASFGLKWGTFKGWHITSPYLDNKEIILAGKTARSTMGMLIKEFNECECLANVYNLINKDSFTLMFVSLEEINEEENIKWTELVQILNNLNNLKGNKLNLTKESCGERLERIFQMWDMKEEISKKDYF